jgi:hypothetical protein
MLLWIEGFEGMGATDSAAPAPAGVMSRKYVNVLQSDYQYLMAGRTGGHCLEMRGWGGFSTPALTTNATVVVGFGFYFAAIANVRIMSLSDGATEGINLRMETTGELAIYRGTTFLARTTGLGLTNATWYWIELKVYCHDTSGTYEVRVGGVNKLSASGVDTKAGSNAYHNIATIPAPNGTVRYDDIYILDGSGAANNDFLGNMKVVGVFPNGDVGGYTDFTPSSGTDHYALVDENPTNDNTDYVESSTTGHKDLWDYGAVSGLGAAIAGLQVNTEVRETDASSFSLITLIKSGATESADSAQAIGSTNYKTLRRISETDPATGAAWTVSGVSAAQFGVKVG